MKYKILYFHIICVITMAVSGREITTVPNTADDCYASTAEKIQARRSILERQKRLEDRNKWLKLQLREAFGEDADNASLMHLANDDENAAKGLVPNEK